METYVLDPITTGKKAAIDDFLDQVLNTKIMMKTMEFLAGHSKIFFFTINFYNNFDYNILS